ncbi:transcription elongation factor TFIIS-like [Typha latifolia]|uniref:transcription elongation factor TFIIS-like n=1 Tax=Typha latifolia TaxID=4733 RepID=UPI003C2C112A
MEKELLETFDAAKKAADAAEVERCVDALRRMKKIPVSTKVLVETQVGKRLRYLTKHAEERIQTVASDILNFWKNVVIEETSKSSTKNNSPREKNSLKVVRSSEKEENIKIERNSNASWAVKSETVSISQNLKAENTIGDVELKDDKLTKLDIMKIERSDSGRVEKVSAGKAIVAGRILKEEKQAYDIKKPTSDPLRPPKLTSVIKCNNPARDKYREILAEAFSKVLDETSKSQREEVRNILDQVYACDPFRVAVTVESVLFEKLGPPTGAQKQKYRSIMFNLKDNNNPDFRRKILLGHVMPEKLVEMKPEEMASDERKLANQQIKEKALFECERAGAPKATTDQFKCGRCGQRKTTYYQLQTRSADEPMTTFVTCVNCNNHWKFC